MNKKRYLVIAGYITSQNDGHTHWISCGELIRLYGIRQEECICVVTQSDFHIKTLGMSKEQIDSLIRLRARDDEQYNVPELMKRS